MINIAFNFNMILTLPYSKPRFKINVILLDIMRLNISVILEVIREVN